MERELFEWCEWDQLDTGIFQFTDCTLKKPIGSFNIGELVPVIVVSFDAGVIQLLTKDGTLISEHGVCLAVTN